jgi:mono/diheme cytochrome c family protein
VLLLLLACAPPCNGLDADGDGVCDRDVADWSQDAWVEPGTHRANIYELDDADWDAVIDQGLLHSMVWPVDVSPLRLPIRPIERMLQDSTLQGLTRDVAGFGTIEELYTRLGMARFDDSGTLPIPPGMGPGDPIGAAVISYDQGDALMFSCASCHASDVFGVPVMGLTTRQPRPNAFFSLAGEILPQVPTDTFQELTDATPGEVEMYDELVGAVAWVGTQDPQVLGLDTSLAQVGLSLAKRGQDPTASFDNAARMTPRESVFETTVADSKPMVWWTLRYKTRWLADGSIVQGNPVHTNFLWNELGRGTDLVELEAWLDQDAAVVDELTVAVFASEAPHWTDWFGTEGLDLELAKQGEQVFLARCAECHGVYDKGWSQGDTGVEAFATTQVWYHGATPTYDVGTDPGRRQGMGELEQLNDLAISQAMETVVGEQDGYVPPPLDGIWLRYPYLHNGSVPTLCALFTPAEQRPTEFWQGPADDPETDFDPDCVGYPIGDAVPEQWTLVEDARVDVSAPGLSNSGHDHMLYDADGELVIGDSERAALIAFLKTL